MRQTADPDVLILDNAEVITANDRFRGHVVIRDGLIVEIGQGRAPERGLDLSGDVLIPGLVEIHTDNLEVHYVPRPKVEWHIGAAVQAYDAQIATAGITTVFDSLRVGLDEHETRSVFASSALPLANAIAEASEQGLMRAEHRLHMRCEVPTPDVVDGLEAFLAHHEVHLMSLMDHTPGQRQFRNLEKYFTYYGGRTGKSDDEVRAIVERRQATGADRAARNRPRLLEIARARAIPLASHDDTTLEEVAQSVADGVTIAEFPTTIEAAEASRAAGLSTVMGAPNVVRGGSHSGNVAATELAAAGALDILSSDYVPASLLMAAFRLTDTPGVGGLPDAIRTVTKNPADATGLTDRGEIAIGKRADLVRVRATGDRPVALQVWRGGARVA